MPRTLISLDAGPVPLRGIPDHRAWGFDPPFAFVWVKPNPSGVGWHMATASPLARTPSVLLGRRGKPRRLRKDVHQLIIHRGASTQKPDELYARVERYCTGPYLELFARQRRRGWTAWGDELDKFEPEYDAHDDFAKSLEEGYRVIRERVAAGGPKWVPK